MKFVAITVKGKRLTFFICSYLKFVNLYRSYLNFSDLKPAVRKLGRRR
ncbi:MAG: hypothetical protein LBP59_19210 [Planctomycetaceae bacterium]|nr:hypothetical protein [Planctomycetaceae bacterium]